MFFFFFSKKKSTFESVNKNFRKAMNQNNPKKQGQVDTLTQDKPSKKLVVHNDDYNTFDDVIDALVEICGQSSVQAEQCTLIIHTKGKYAVKEGDYKYLKPMKDGITDRGINATIEE